MRHFVGFSWRAIGKHRNQSSIDALQAPLSAPNPVHALNESRKHAVGISRMNLGV